MSELTIIRAGKMIELNFNAERRKKIMITQSVINFD